MARAMTHAENAYYIPNIEIRGTVCRTNFPPNTAFRGFGGPQGVANIENMMEEIAAFLKKDALDVRRAQLLRHRDAQHHAVRTGRRATTRCRGSSPSCEAHVDYARAHERRARLQRELARRTSRGCR